MIKNRITVTLKRKLIAVFFVLILIVGFGITIASVRIFANLYRQKADQYIWDVAKQTTNNFQNKINTFEKMTFDVLSNPTIQEHLKIVNSKELSEYEMRREVKKIENELISHALYNEDVISFSVISLDGKEFTVQQIEEDPIVQMFNTKEIYNKKGSTLWTITNDGEYDICIARAILSLKTQKPIGYINIICDEDYFGSIVKKILGSYTSGSYIVDKSNVVVSTNDKEYLGENFFIKEDLLQQEKRFERLNYNNNYVYISSEMSNGWSLVTTVDKDEIGKELRSFTKISIIIATIAILLSILAIFLVVGRIIKPIEELKKTMVSVGKGNFNKRVNIETNDEIGALSDSFNKMTKDIGILVDRVYNMEILQKQSEIEKLKMQINPHFLYNTLDTINWMAIKNKNNDIADMVVTLADLLRGNLKESSKVTIEEEIKNVRNYLFIEEYRFSDKIEIIYDIDEECRGYIIPAFILQPIIENAIIHGIEPKDRGKLCIKIKSKSNRIKIEICDNGVGMTKEEIDSIYEVCKEEGGRQYIGIKNVFRRLRILYDNDCNLEINSKKNKYTKILIDLPINNKSTKKGE